MNKTALILKHTHQDGSCFLGKTLEEEGFSIRSIGVPTTDFSDFDPLEADLLLVMGGPIGVYQAEDYPFIYDELNILEKRLAADRPTLGICLGSQLIAKALGGEVFLGPQGKEVGWHPLTLTEAGKRHAVRHLGGDKTNMFHWHNDTFTLPGDATLLASSGKYNHQIFSYGRRALGLQCHTEVREIRLREWYVTLVREITGEKALMKIDDLKKQTLQYVDTLNAQTRTFFLEWLHSVDLREVPA
jgi:GMP synthase (glutamine-hydrolysing)